MNTEEPHAKKEKPHPKLNMGICNANCLLLFPSLAQLIGLNEAIVLQQVHFWMCVNWENEKDKSGYQTHLHDGRWWVYNAVNTNH